MSVIASQLEAGRAQLEAEKAAGLALLHAKQSAVASSDPLHNRMRSFISHSADERLTTDFSTYHCAHCSRYALILDRPLHLLPTRNTDGAHVLVRRKRVMKLTVERGEVTAIRRERGVEKQWRWACRQCGLPIAYQCEAWGETRKERGKERKQGKEEGEGEEEGEFADLLYVMKDALVGLDEAREAQADGTEEGGEKGEEEERRGARGDAASRTNEEEEIEKEIAELRKQNMTGTEENPSPPPIPYPDPAQLATSAQTEQMRPGGQQDRPDNA